MGIFDRPSRLTLPAKLLPSTVVEKILPSVEGPAARINHVLSTTSAYQSIPRRGTRELLAAWRQMPHLRNVVGRLAVSVGAVRWRVYRSASRGKAKALDSHDWMRRKDAVNGGLAKGELVEVPDHPLARLLERFNPEMSGVAARRLTQIYLELKGEAFFLIERQNGVPVEMWPVPTHWVHAIPEGTRDTYEIRWRAATVFVKREDMLYLKDLDPEDPYLRGTGTAETLADELDTDEYASKFLKHRFANHAMPTHLIGVEGVGGDEIAVAAETWRAMNGGARNYGRTHFTEGKLSPIRLDDKLVDMEIVELRQYESAIVRETFNVPPEVVGHTENSNRATSQAAMENLALLCVQPRLEFLRGEYATKLVPLYPDGETIVLEYDDPVPMDRAAQLEAAKAAPWALSKNEWREMQGHGEVEGGDVYPAMPTALPGAAGAAAGADITINELTLGIERLGRLGDIVQLNDLRRALAAKLGVPYGGDIDASTLASAAATVDPTIATPSDGEKTITRAFDEDEIDEVLRAIAPVEIEFAVMPTSKLAIEHFGGEMGRSLGVSFNMLSPRVVEHLAVSSDKITEINETTRDEIRAELIQGVAKGEGIGPLSSRVRKAMGGARRHRTRVIARTEVIGNANFARLEAMEIAGPDIVPQKKWLTSIDGRQRDTHEAMNGQIVALNEDFKSPDGDHGPCPGRLKLAKNTIQCRCAVLPVVDPIDKGVVDTVIEEAAWRAFDRAAARFESRMIAALETAFAKQEHQILMAVERLAR